MDYSNGNKTIPRYLPMRQDGDQMHLLRSRHGWEKATAVWHVLLQKLCFNTSHTLMIEDVKKKSVVFFNMTYESLEPILCTLIEIVQNCMTTVSCFLRLYVSH